MYRYKDITSVQIEITEKCNAACPACSRAYYGYGELAGTYQKHMSLDEFKFLLTSKLVSNLERVIFCGNVGDAQVNPNLPQMVDYLYSCNNDIIIEINTNGGMHSTDYWANFAKYKNMKIWFAVDGTTQEVHSYYRQNTNLKKVLENAKAFIDAGGNAILQFILFKHNQHQFEDVKELAKEYNFAKIEIINTDRPEDTPVYTSKGEYVGQLQGAEGLEDYDRYLTDQTENIKNNEEQTDIKISYPYLDAMLYEVNETLSDLFKKAIQKHGKGPVYNIAKKYKAHMFVSEDDNQIDQINIKEYTSFLKIAQEKYVSQNKSWEEEAEKFIWVKDSLWKVANIEEYDNVDVNKVLRGLPSSKKHSNRKINCMAVTESKVFITADGFVYPCCMMGHNHTRIANEYTYDLRELLLTFGFKNDANNALKYGGIEEVFKTGFFDTIANTWTPNTTENRFLQTLNADYGDCGNLNMCASACSNCDYNA